MELIYCGYCGGKGCLVCRPDKHASGYGWTMEDELTFVRNLGRWQVQQRGALNRREILKGYLTGLAKRRRWSNLNAETLRQTALQLLVGENSGS